MKAIAKLAGWLAVQLPACMYLGVLFNYSIWGLLTAMALSLASLYLVFWEELSLKRNKLTKKE